MKYNKKTLYQVVENCMDLTKFLNTVDEKEKFVKEY